MSEARLAKEAYDEIRREILDKIQNPENRAKVEKIIEDLYGFLR